MLYNNLARAYRLEKRPAEAVLLTLERRKLWGGDPRQLARLPRDFLLAANLAPAGSSERRRYTEHALETVAEALAAGYRDVDGLRKDRDLEPLRKLPEFEALLRKYDGK
ncbi:MAG TPA: hypothetical protein VFA26_06035, partial [Gemmataceae bacterium]|nr:hypothetical protein [Gemmataceae bacterium]